MYLLSVLNTSSEEITSVQPGSATLYYLGLVSRLSYPMAGQQGYKRPWSERLYT